MTHIEAMKQWLEALESYHGYMEPLTTVFGGPRVPVEQSTTGKVEKAITSLRQAIATEESSATQEPVLWAAKESMFMWSKSDESGHPYHIVCKGKKVRSHQIPLYTHPKAEQGPISDVTEAVTKTVIEVEKLLCEKLGRSWQASGMSIQTLVDELAQPKAEQSPLTDEWFRKTMLELYNIELKQGDYADDILLVRAVEAAHGIKGEA